MGFWSMVTGVDAFAGTYNAVVMEHTLQVMSPADVARLQQQLPLTTLSGLGTMGNSPEAAIAFLQKASRVVQLNMLAFAMADLELRPALPGELWVFLKNPFAALPDTLSIREKVRSRETEMLRKHGVKISVPLYRLNLADLSGPGFDQPARLCFSSPTPEPPPLDLDQRLRALEDPYYAGELSDEEMAEATLALGHTFLVCSDGERTAFDPKDLLVEGEVAERFLAALRWSEEWSALGEALEDGLRAAAYVHAVELEYDDAIRNRLDLTLSVLLLRGRQRMVDSQLI